MTRSRVTLGNITSGQTPGSGELSVPTADNSSSGHPVIRRPSYPGSENIPEFLDKTGTVISAVTISKPPPWSQLNKDHEIGCPGDHDVNVPDMEGSGQ